MTSSNPVERELFHGTSPSGAEKICSDGFDRGFAGKNGKCCKNYFTYAWRNLRFVAVKCLAGRQQKS